MLCVFDFTLIRIHFDFFNFNLTCFKGQLGEQCLGEGYYGLFGV